jgi:hypothetical protein
MASMMARAIGPAVSAVGMSADPVGMSGLSGPRTAQPLPILRLDLLRLWLHRILHICVITACHNGLDWPVAPRTPERASSHAYELRLNIGIDALLGN